jgi:hypothetical protein
METSDLDRMGRRKKSLSLSSVESHAVTISAICQSTFRKCFNDPVLVTLVQVWLPPTELASVLYIQQLMEEELTSPSKTTTKTDSRTAKAVAICETARRL